MSVAADVLSKDYCHKLNWMCRHQKLHQQLGILWLRHEQLLQLVMKREGRRGPRAKQQQELPVWACKLPRAAMFHWVVLNTM